MKEEILALLNMKDILNKYGIKIKKYMCNCPFHKDNSPSMKIYDKSFYCFGCNKTGDLIQFVQYYFNLNFQEAIEKINFDFGLNLQTRGRVNKNKLIEIKKKFELEKIKKQKQKEIINNKLIKVCNRYRIYDKVLRELKTNITIDNWEDKINAALFLEDKLVQLDDYFDNLLYKLKEVD